MTSVVFIKDIKTNYIPAKLFSKLDILGSQFLDAPK